MWEFYEREPNSARSGELFAAGVSLHRAPGQIIIDNGSGFRADAFAGGRPNRKRNAAGDLVHPLVQELGVQIVHFARPYNHKAKRAEPFFHYFAEHFDRMWRSYIGNAPRRKPLETDKGDVMILPTMEDIRRLGGAWLTETYCRQPSPAQAAGGLSPLRAFTELREPGKRYPRPTDEALCLLCRPSRLVRVYQNGVWAHECKGWYWHPRLVERQADGEDFRRKVRYRVLPGRTDRIYIEDGDGRFLCWARRHLGNSMHPLIDARTQPEEAQRLTDAMCISASIRRLFTRQVEAAVTFADAHLLAGQHRALAALAALDQTTSAPPSPSDTPTPPGLLPLTP